MGVDHWFEVCENGKVVDTYCLNNLRRSGFSLYRCDTIFNTIMYVKKELKDLKELPKIDFSKFKEEVLGDIQRASNYDELSNVFLYHSDDLCNVSKNSSDDESTKRILEEFLEMLLKLDCTKYTGCYRSDGEYY